MCDRNRHVVGYFKGGGWFAQANVLRGANAKPSPSILGYPAFHCRKGFALFLLLIVIAIISKRSLISAASARHQIRCIPNADANTSTNAL
jgi:hypothetical protein